MKFTEHVYFLTKLINKCTILNMIKRTIGITFIAIAHGSTDCNINDRDSQVSEDCDLSLEAHPYFVNRNKDHTRDQRSASAKCKGKCD